MTHSIGQGIFNSLMYSKVIRKGEISIAQLLTLEFKVFLAKNFFKGKWSSLELHLLLPGNKWAS